jgi:hypothetical protein
MGYASDWDSTDQVPRRLVESGVIDRFGNVDPSLGGETHRASLAARWERITETLLRRWEVYGLSYDLRLVSNFTYFLDDPAAGDEFVQQDDRRAWGASYRTTRFSNHGGHDVEQSFGVEMRLDDIDNGLYGAQQGAVASTVRADSIRQLTGGAYYEVGTPLGTDRVRMRAALRVDGYAADVESSLAENSGDVDDVLASPKLSFIFGPGGRAEGFVNAGYGFHSNDARGATIRIDPKTGAPADPVPPLVRAEGADVGFRLSPRPGASLALSVFGLELDSELVFVGDAGTTEAGRPSRRTGVELSTVMPLARWLQFDLDGAYSRARFRDPDPAGEMIPGAAEVVIGTGLAVTSPRGWEGALRWRYLGPRPLIEDGSVESSSTSLFNLAIAKRIGTSFRIGVEIFNLFDREDSDIEYFYASRLPQLGEPPEGVEDIHFHPVEPFSLRLTAAWTF